MKKQLANFFEIIPLKDIDTIVDQVITPKAGKTFDRLQTRNNIVVSDKLKDTSGNTWYEQTSNMVCSKLESEISEKYKNQLPILLKLYYTEGTVLIWGDILEPVRVSLTSDVNHDQLKMIRKSVTPLY